MANKYLDFNGLSTYDNKIKQYITNKEQKITDKISKLDGLSVEGDDESGYNNLEVYNTVEVDNLITDANAYTDTKVSEISKDVNEYISKITSANAANAANQISYDDSESNIGSTNVQSALNSLSASVKPINEIKQNIGINDFSEFSKNAQYQKDDIVIYNGKLYKFTIGHTASEWDTTHVKEITLRDTINPKNISFNSDTEKIVSTNISDAINELVNKGENSTTSKISINAGYEIGADPKDTSLFGVTNNTSTIQILNNYQIQYKDNISNSSVGSKFRGTFWKVNFSELKDIKGTFLINSALGTSYYKYFVISSSVKDIINSVTIQINLTDNEFNAYNLITEALLSTNDNIKNEAQTIQNNKYFYIAVLNYYSDGKANPLTDIISIFHSPEQIAVKANNFTDNAINKINTLINDYNNKATNINCWGGTQMFGKYKLWGRNDKNIIETLNSKGWSFTSVEETFPNILQQLFNNSINVFNFGGNDETINAMFCKQGSNTLHFSTQTLIPSENNLRVPCELQDSFGNDIIFNFLNDNDNPINPCFINGIQCAISYNYVLNTMYIEKNDTNNSLNKAIQVNKTTQIILNSNKNTNDIEIFWLNEYLNGNDLENLKNIIYNLKTKKYLILGPVGGNINSENSCDIEKFYYQYFGNHFINLRDYFANYALSDFGITMTTDDDFTTEQLQKGVKSDSKACEEGSLPSTFWPMYFGETTNSKKNISDLLSGPAYAIVAYVVYNRIIQLNLI